MAKTGSDMPLMSIVVLNWNGLEDTKICLEHLRKLDYPNYEIIVVDNGSKPAQKKYLRGVKDIILVDNPVNRGFTGGHIDGLAKASGEYIVLLNNDAVMKYDYLHLALKHFTDPKIAAVGGRSYFWNETDKLLDESNPFYSYQNITNATGEAFTQRSDSGLPQEVNNVSGSAVVVKKSVIDKIGYLHDEFFAYFEETDLFARIKRAGYKVIYDPDLRIWHKVGASSGSESGSYFFFYQIFRNRFIFAMRNYETRSLPRFIYHYKKITLGSLFRLAVHPSADDKVMNKAYVRAALWNLGHIFHTLGERRALTKQLGKSTYNHQIYKEQTGVSFIYDATRLDKKLLRDLRNDLQHDRNPMHEYIVVTKEPYSSDYDPEQPNFRYVIDRGYFAGAPLNLGCLAARFDWIALTDVAGGINPDHVHDALAATMRKKRDVIALGDPNTVVGVVISKSFFQFIGGVKKAGERKLFTDLIAYARQKGTLVRHQLPGTATHPVNLLPVSAEKMRKLDLQIKADTAIAKTSKIGLYGRLQQKYYRLFQLTNLIRWIFLPKIPLRLKAARLRNVAVFTSTLQIRPLALELKHMRNEVVLATVVGDVARQERVIKQQTLEALEQPQDIPVFIICRDRVECLEQQVKWLQGRGLTKIIFIDNDSAYPPLVDYFNRTPYQVLRLYRNVGHTSPWALSIIRALVPEQYYIVTDPDVVPVEDCPDTFLTHLLNVHDQFKEYLKVGLGLKIDDLPDHYPLKQSVIDWEEQFWTVGIGEDLYEAGVDTTFALYKPFTYTYTLHPSIRTGGNYVARHLPWYGDPKIVSAEENFYRLHLDPSVNSWNTDEIADRYAKELAKASKK